MWSNRNSYSLLVGMQNGTATLEDSLVVYYKTKRNFTMQSSNQLFTIYPNELKTYDHTKTYAQMLTAALFIITKIWKQPRCPSIGEWINKL